MRTQINIRIDSELDEAIEAKIKELGVKKTDFITNAIKTALGMPTATASDVAPAELEQLIASRIADIEHRLASRIAEVEKKLAA